MGARSEKNNLNRSFKSNEVFIGDWEDITKFSSLQISAIVDNPAILTIDFSHDRETICYNATLANENSPLRINNFLPRMARFFRIYFKNGEAKQKNVSAQIILGDFIVPMNFASNEIFNKYQDIINVRALLFAKQEEPDSTYTSLVSDETGRLKTEAIIKHIEEIVNVNVQNTISANILGVVQTQIQNTIQAQIQNIIQATIQNVVQTTVQNTIQAEVHNLLQTEIVGTIPTIIQNVPTVAIQGNVPVNVQGTIPVSAQGITPVSVQGSASVNVNGTVPVNVQNTVSVLASTTLPVAIQGTPSVTVQGVPSVAIQGTPSVAIQSMPSVTLQGTSPVSIQNVPGVSIQGIPQTTSTLLNPSIKTEIIGPINQFGTINSSQDRLSFQENFIYNINQDKFSSWTQNATIIADQNLCKLNSHAINGFARLTTKYFIKNGSEYISRFSASFSANPANAAMFLGPISDEAGYAFGRKNGTPSIFLRSGGKREIRTLTIPTTTIITENVTITLEGITKIISVIAGTSFSNAYKISIADFSSIGNGWDAYSNGNTIIFICRKAKVLTGTFSLTSTGIMTGSFVQNTIGIAPTDTWIPQTNWLDKMDGTGQSGANLDFSKINTFEIAIQPNSNAAQFRVQTIEQNRISNILVYSSAFSNTTTILQPMPFSLETFNPTVSDVTLSCSNIAISLRGQETKNTSPTILISKSSIGTTEIPIISLKNPLIFVGKPNHIQRKMIEFGITMHSGNNVLLTLNIRKNGTLIGAPNFAEAAQNYPILMDSAATGFTGGQIVFSRIYTEFEYTKESIKKTNLILEPGDLFVFTIQASSGTAGSITLTIDSQDIQ